MKTAVDFVVVLTWTALLWSSSLTVHASAILDKRVAASSCVEIQQQMLDVGLVAHTGIYELLGSNGYVVKAFCDMETDGGGWLLVGKIDQPSFWTVTSTSRTITLNGLQGISNRFGTMPVKDFRFQFSTSPCLDDTKGHWYYHLGECRKLELLLTSGTTNGCGEDAVSGIEFTQDLLSGKKHPSHRCSGFQDSTQTVPFNGCFNSTGCPSDAKVSYTNDGSFSFHATGSVSGQDTSSAAFFGCDDSLCCACWGPVGGTDAYCANNCVAQNGGTKVSAGQAWMYVR